MGVVQNVKDMLRTAKSIEKMLWTEAWSSYNLTVQLSTLET